MNALVIFLIALSLSQTDENAVGIPWNGKTLMDLRNEYSTIFPHHNRNAASHRWATFLLERAGNMEKSTFEHMFSGFCPVSGSPIGNPSLRTLWKMAIPLAGNQTKHITGGIHFCCWPCVCDTADFIRVDTKNVTMRDGTFKFNFLVLGNPCAKDQGAHIPYQAPDATCFKEHLVKATYSDNGFVIIGLLQDLPKNVPQDEIMVAGHCESRAENGYRSGMGTIFREVAGINPIHGNILPGSYKTELPGFRSVTPPKSEL